MIVNKLLSKIKYIILLILIINIPAFSKDNGTPFSVKAGAYLNGVIYNADFKNLPGVENCCSSFRNAFKLSYDIEAGFEYKFSLLDIPSALDLSVVYSDLSATFKPQYPFANIITGNTYTKGVSEYILTPDIKAILFEPGIYLYPFNNIPLSFRVGLNAGILMGNTFSQEERLVSPSNAYFENGSKVRGVYSGAITNASKTAFSASVGVRYRIFKSGNFSFLPEIRFNYGLSDLVTGIKWKASNLLAGISVTYNFPKEAAAPPLNPPAPPMPEAPQPPAPSYVNLDLIVSINGDKQQKDSTYVIFVKEYLTTLNYSLLPIIFYDENGTVPLGEGKVDVINFNENIGELGAHQNLTKAIAKLMTDNPELKVIIVSSSLMGEEPAISDARINNVSNELISGGISVARLNIIKKVIAKEDISRQELIPESTFIRFELSDGTKLIPYTIQKDKRYDIPPLELNVRSEIKSSSGIEEFNGKLTALNDTNFGAGGISVPLNGTVIDNSDKSKITIARDLIVEANVQNRDKKSADAIFNMKYALGVRETNETVNRLEDTAGVSSQYVLCYFDYDRSEPKVINENVAKLVKDAIAKGKKVTFLAQTDNLGTENYNSDLAIKRGRKAMDMFNGNSGKIKLIHPTHYIFSNATPLGRVLNRSVVVRIED